MRVKTEDSEILKVFRGARVLVTGGTGFMGQMLVEKLLRTCEIDKLYLIVRPKKGLTEKERIDKVFDGVLYERLKQEQPKSLSKVVLVSGNCEQRGLGLSEEDRATLVREVNIVFHSAATVRFDAKLWTATAINVLAAKDLMDLSKEMPQLKAFVHISSAYSNCPHKEIDEKFYTPPITWTELVQLVDSMDHDALETITPVILGEWPNTYSFTKALAEDMIRDQVEDLPLSIIRPSIVVGTAYEPITSWINSFYGACGVVVGAGEGLLKSMHCNDEIAADVVPVDMSINAALAIAWDVAQEKDNNVKELKNSHAKLRTSNTGETVPIFNYVSSTQNYLNWGDFMRLNENLDYPSMRCIWYYCFCLNKHRILHNMYITFLHLLPAILMDLGAKIVGKKAIMWSAYQKIHKFTDVIAYFTTQQWLFHDNNTQNLWGNLNSTDKTLFPFDISSIDWDIYMYSMVRGVRLYVVGDGFERIDETRARYRRLKYLHYAVVYTFGTLVTYVMYQTVSCCWRTYKDAVQ